MKKLFVLSVIIIVFGNSCNQKELEILKAQKINFELEIENQQTIIEQLGDKIHELENEKSELSYEKGNSAWELERLRREFDSLKKGTLTYTETNFPITSGFEKWSGYGLHKDFGYNPTPIPDIKFHEVYSTRDKNDLLKTFVFSPNNLYAFILDEFADINWDKDYGNEEPPLSSIGNPGKAAEIFDKAAAFYNGFIREKDHIALTNLYRGTAYLMGVIKSTENLKTKFNVPLGIDAAETLFGLPNYYIAEKRPVEDMKMLIMVYQLTRGHFLIIFYDNVLQGICLL